MKSPASVAVIGGGIVGASIAYRLATKGVKDVVVFEKSRFGSGSTSSSLGGFRHQFSNELSIRLSKESIKIIEKFKDLTGYDPLAKKDGYLFVAAKEESFAQLKKNRELARGLSVPVDLLEQSELQTRFPFYDFEGLVGGTLCMEDGHASTLALLQGFISKSKELGVELYEYAEVLKIERSGSKLHTLQTSLGKIEAEKIVIASGAYSGLVGQLASIQIPIKPFPRKILVTHPFRDGIPEQIPLIIDVDSTLGIGREGSGILMADNGPNESSFDLIFSPDYDDRVLSLALRRVPVLKNASVSYANSGLYEMTPDANPIISEVKEASGFYCCAGFAGHGFMHAPIVGELMAEILTGSKPHLDISAFDIGRFGDLENNPREALVI
jgi:sarcosine oxidase, subunit beta